MEKQKIKILLVGELFDEYELFSANLLDFDKIELLNAINLEDAMNVFFENQGIDIIIFLKSAFEYFESLEDLQNYGFDSLEDKINEIEDEDVGEKYIDLATEAINKYIDENPDLIIFEEAQFDENEVKRVLPKFINFLRSFEYSGVILASTNVPDIANKFLKAGCSGSITSIYGAHTLIDQAYLQKNKTLPV